MAGLDRQCTAVILPPPPPFGSLDSRSMNICCVQSGFGHDAEGVDGRWGQTNLCAHCNDFLWPPPSLLHPPLDTSSSSLSSWSSQGADVRDVWVLNGSLLPKKSCYPARSRFPPSLPQFTSVRICAHRSTLYKYTHQVNMLNIHQWVHPTGSGPCVQAVSHMLVMVETSN